MRTGHARAGQDVDAVGGVLPGGEDRLAGRVDVVAGARVAKARDLVVDADAADRHRGPVAASVRGRREGTAVLAGVARRDGNVDAG